jgi:hypothetical protein
MPTAEQKKRRPIDMVQTRPASELYSLLEAGVVNPILTKVTPKAHAIPNMS